MQVSFREKPSIAQTTGFYLDVFTWGESLPPPIGGIAWGGYIPMGGIARMRFATYFEMVN